jgi:hypothetical protein
MVSLTAWLLDRVTQPKTHITKGLVGSKKLSGSFGQLKILLRVPRTEPRFLDGPARSQVTILTMLPKLTVLI